MIPEKERHMSALGDLVRDYARGRVSFQVGHGECADLAIEALRTAGARSTHHLVHGFYQWGAPVAIDLVERGDILEFVNHRIVRRFAGGWGVTEQRGNPYHTAIVLENLGNGVVRVAEQNMIYQGAPAYLPRTVQTAVVYLRNQTL